jgi:hypothetical protein
LKEFVMFEFVGLSRPMLAYLEEYLADPWWCHSTDVVPMVAMSPPVAWPLWTAEALSDEGVLTHLIASLKRWRAFRTRRPVADAHGTLRRHLAEFISDIQAMPEARPCLSDVSEAGVQRFAVALTARLRRFGLAVKGSESCVLPSKTAHFLLLGLVPAYDGQVIRDSTLWWLAPHACDRRSYVLLCWWVLRRFGREGTLQEAREAVADYMLNQPMPWTRRLPRPAPDHWLLRSMDSVVAEYTLIQMARGLEQRFLLRWAAPVRV